jgi:hypothetical protein
VAWGYAMSVSFDRAAYAAAMNGHYDALDAALVAKGFPATSPWWRAEVRRYFEHGGRQAVFRVGRRGGKSSTLCRIAAVEAWYGAHNVPPGDIGIVAFISVSRDEANQRLRTIKAIHDACGVEYKPIEFGIELLNRRIGFKTYAASISGVSGPTIVLAVCDEVAKWRDADSGQNPAKEVLASLRPALATMPLAKVILSSSPLGRSDAHAAAFEIGDNDYQFAAHAPTWTANPTITEAETHRLEPDERVWKREYLAEPQDGAVASQNAADVAAALRMLAGTSEQRGRPMLFVDASGGGDNFGYLIGTWVTEPCGASIYLEREIIDSKTGKLSMRMPVYDSQGAPVPNPDHRPPAPRLVVSNVGSFTGEQVRAMGFAMVVAHLAAMAREYGATTAKGDVYNSGPLETEFGRHGIAFKGEHWTADQKVSAASTLRRLLRERDLVIPPGERTDALKRQILELEEHFLPSGRLTISMRRSGGSHSDECASLMLLCKVETAGGLSGSPYKKNTFSSSWDPYEGAADESGDPWTGYR